jgi:hypothetical protein
MREAILTSVINSQSLAGVPVSRDEAEQLFDEVLADIDCWGLLSVTQELVEFADHGPRCATRRTIARPCDCGYDTAYGNWVAAHAPSEPGEGQGG